MTRRLIYIALVVAGLCALGVFAVGQIHRPEPSPHHLLLLWDNSVSRQKMGTHQPEALPTLAKVGHDWAIEAPQDSLLEFWCFTPRDSALEIERPFYVKKPIPKPPVKLWQERFVADVSDGLERSLRKAGRDELWSPMLEGTWRLIQRGEPLSGSYEIRLLGIDLLQTSRRWCFTRDFLSKHKDAEILESIRLGLPASSHPPQKITVYFYPGMSSNGRSMTGEYEHHLRKVFSGVFQQVWNIPEVQFEELQ